MSTTTSNGYIKPSTGDRGYFTNLEFNIDRVNSHVHSGLDGQQISAKDLIKATTDILAANWVAVSGQAGTYSQTITLPTGLLMATCLPRFYVNGGTFDGSQVWLSIQSLTTTTYKVLANDNTLTLKAVYG